ncbi:MAG TPA: hypothetical protein VF612_12395 [Jatrophihabitans sp.]|jgi:hypothetical protein|uniref:hypothetical protein n=1 Tax=Jatrophihabitans sp. TaxID=1932789 RepID=UPI002EE65E96
MVEFVGLVGGHDQGGGKLAGGAGGQEGYGPRGDGLRFGDDPHQLVTIAVRAADGEVHGEIDGPSGFVHGDRLAGNRAGNAERPMVAAGR